MENKHIALILIIVFFLLAVVSVFGFYFISSQVISSPVEVEPQYDDTNLNNETFGKINVSVPADLKFKDTDPNDIYYADSFESEDKMIFIESYSEKFSKDELKRLVWSEFEDGKHSEVKLDGLPKNAKAYKNEEISEIITVVVTDDSGDQAIVLTVVNNDKLAVKMAKSVIFLS